MCGKGPVRGRRASSDVFRIEENGETLMSQGDSMFEKILYPTDFSDVAQAAVRHIEDLRCTGAREVIILHVIDSRIMDLLVYNPLVAMELEKNLRDDASFRINAVRTRLEEIGYQVTARVVVGIPTGMILRVEKEEDVSVIVLGSHGKSNVREMLLGSVSEGVIRSAARPVLVVKR
jgi:nucleotide-binding universal stress UspA family protein